MKKLKISFYTEPYSSLGWSFSLPLSTMTWIYVMIRRLWLIMATPFISLNCSNSCNICPYVRARLHETRSELKTVWNLKPLWNVVPFTWQFTWTFRCGNFPNNSKTLLHICKWYILVNANLIDARKSYQW